MRRLLRKIFAAIADWCRDEERQTPDEWERRLREGRELDERRAFDALLLDFAKRYHSAPPGTPVGLAVPKGMKLQVVATEALRRYPTLEACR